MQSFYREREERGGACSCRTLPDAKSPQKMGGGVLGVYQLSNEFATDLKPSAIKYQL